MNPSVLILLSVSIIGLLGFAHLVLTFRGPKLLPRDPALKEAMASVKPVITGQTNIWRMWIGFNASHSMGAMLIGLVYGYLALNHSELLLESLFLQGVGFAMLAGFTTLARLYWFITPFLGSALSLFMFTLAIVLARLG